MDECFTLTHHTIAIIRQYVSKKDHINLDKISSYDLYLIIM